MALLKRNDLDHSIYVESHGVVIRLTSNSPDALVAVLPEKRRIFPVVLSTQNADILTTSLHTFGIRDALTASIKIAKRSRSDADANGRFNAGSQIALAVAEYAPKHTFVNAGVCCHQRQSYRYSGKSFAGKTRSLTNS